MRRNYIYIVTFDMHKDCRIYDYIYHCMAPNAKEACKIAREAWHSDSYQFHIHAVKSRIQNLNMVTVRNEYGREYHGSDAMDKFICTHSVTWRYKASNGRYVYPLYK